MNMRDVMEKAGVVMEVHRSLTYEEYGSMMKIVCPHGPDEPCTCDGCGACKGRQVGCTCDIDWDLMVEVRDMWYA